MSQDRKKVFELNSLGNNQRALFASIYLLPVDATDFGLRLSEFLLSFSPA